MKRLQLRESLYPPEDILNSKSIVLLSVPEVAQRSQWMMLVSELQQFFAEQGIDAVAYIENEALFSKPNQVLEIPDLFRKREIRNLILFSAGKKEEPVFLAIGPYNGKNSFFDKSASFWARYSIELSSITDELRKYFQTGSLKRANLLVNESPEFFYPELSLGIVSKSIPPKLAEFKVLIQGIDTAFYATQKLALFRYDKLFKEDSFNLSMADRNYFIRSLVVDTTNNIFEKESGKTIRQLRKEGFQYELTYVTAPEGRMYDLLPFPGRPKATDSIVYKFYLSDLRNNNIYIGKIWDAAADWNTALKNFLGQMKDVIQKNPN